MLFFYLKYLQGGKKTPASLETLKNSIEWITVIIILSVIYLFIFVGFMLSAKGIGHTEAFLPHQRNEHRVYTGRERQNKLQQNPL